MLVVERDISNTPLLCIHHLCSTTLSPTSSRLIAPVLRVSLSHIHTHMLQTASLIWNINLHFSPLHWKHSTHKCSDAVSMPAVSHSYTLSFLQLWLKRLRLHVATTSQQYLNLKHFLSSLPTFSSLLMDTSSVLIKGGKAMYAWQENESEIEIENKACTPS